MNEHITPRVLDVLEWPVIREELRRRCMTPAGEKLVFGLAPIGTEAVRTQMRKISNLKELIGQNRAPDFSGVPDIGPSVALAEKGGVLKLEELAALRSFMIASGRTMKFLKEEKDEFPLLAEEYGRMDRLAGIADIFIGSITENGELSESAYPELRRIRDELFLGTAGDGEKHRQDHTRPVTWRPFCRKRSSPPATTGTSSWSRPA